MSLMNKMMKPFEAAFLEYTQFIAGEYGIDQEVLLKHWNDRTKMKIHTKDTPKKPRSAYHVFSAEVRKELEKEEKKYSFGEISVLIGTRWKALSAEEKAQYAVTTAIVAATTTVPTKPKELSKTELLEKAEALGLKISKSKSKAQIMEEIRKAEAGDEEEEDDASVASSVKPKELSKTELLEKAEALGLKISKSKSKAQIMEEIRKAEAGDEEEEDDASSLHSEAEDADDASMASPVNSDSEEEDEEDPLVMYKAMKPQDLAEMCTQHGLSSKGNKDTLIKRLIVNNIK
jgi:hypothetical protein